MKNKYKEIEHLFSRPPNFNQRVWGLIHSIQHIVLTYCEKENIKIDKRKLNLTPNSPIKRLVEITEIGEINIEKIITNEWDRKPKIK